MLHGMKKIFNHILVPVSFSRNSSMVMDKAIQVANRFDCDIHLLYVQIPAVSIPFVYDGHFPGSPPQQADEEAERKLNELADRYRRHLKEGLLMTTTWSIGNWHFVLKEQVITRHIDLVILPCNEKRIWENLLRKIDVNELALQTQCPVLTVTETFDAGHLKNIVVPVGDFLPIRKLTAATYLARQFNAVIHLMGGKGESYGDDKKRTRVLTRAYQLLRDYTNVKVYCSTQQGKVLAEDTLAYAQNINADLIVVNPGRESRLKGWFNKWMGKYLYKESKIPVLTIAPQA